MSVQVTPHTFLTLEKEWEELLSSATVNSLFLTPYWQRIWWEAFGGEDQPLLLAFQDQGEPVGIAPMMRQDGVLSFLGEPDLFDYHDFIVPQGRETAFYRCLTEYLTSEEWRTVRLDSLPEESPTLTHLPDLARAQGWTCLVEQEDVAPGLYLPGDWDSYVSGLSKKDRHELRRKLRRLGGVEGVSHHVCSDPEAIQGCLDDFLGLMGQSKEEKRDFLTPERQAFFRSITEDLAARGMLRLYFTAINGNQVAATLCFDYHDQRLLYNSGFDPEYASLSVGLLLNARSLEDAIDGRMRYFDFLRGDEPYKYHLGGLDRRIYRMVITR
ncbi:MAG: GNAT family N-acetyltransferase [Chloroflexi bacterium]|nr:GNAT family N-acetyltransferase [Chloroflexota bacterium]